MKKQCTVVLAVLMTAVFPAFAQPAKAVEQTAQTVSKTMRQTSRVVQKTNQATTAAQRAAIVATREMQTKAMQEVWKEISTPIIPTAVAVKMLPEYAQPDAIADMFNALNGEDFQTAEQLLKKGVDINAVTEKSEASFRNLLTDFLVRNNKKKQIVWLLEHGANPNKILFEGITIMHYVAAWGKAEYFPILKKYGADFNIQNAFKQTPLHEAINNFRNTETLVRLGADPSIRDVVGNTPYDRAVKTLRGKFSIGAGNEVPKVIEYYENFIFPVTVAQSTEAGIATTVQTARFMWPSEVQEALAVEKEVKLYMPEAFYQKDVAAYQGITLNHLVELQRILTIGLEPARVQSSAIGALSYAVPSIELEALETEAASIPVIVKIPATGEDLTEQHIPSDMLSDVMAFLSIGGKPGWYKVTLQDGDLIFTPAPTKAVPGYLDLY